LINATRGEVSVTYFVVKRQIMRCASTTSWRLVLSVVTS